MRTLTLIAISGSAYLAAMIVLAASAATLGTPVFFACVGVAVVAYITVLWIVWRAPADRARWLMLAVLFAVAVRVPLLVPRVNTDNDMVRYLWDGRVQVLGYNPYAVRPAEPGLAFTHTDQTRGMPSARQRTPYPPAAQMFFRFVVTVYDSARAMKIALVLCDLLTILVLWRWLAVTGRDEPLVLAYAWNPLVVLEVAHSGHIDALGALWIAAAAFWMARGRTALSTIAFVLAVATKLLPVVLLPLLWRRISIRDALVGLGLLVLLYLPYAQGVDVLFGVQNVVQHVRFNGPIFKFIREQTSPDVAARVALAAGLLVAAWCRWRLDVRHPATWASPMAASIAFAPVIYPWYLLYCTPFLLLPSALPLLTWCCTILLTYAVWEIAQRGGPWVVPPVLLAVEYALPVTAAAALLVGRQRALRFLGHEDPQQEIREDPRERD